MKNGFLYLCAVIDWYSRFILSWEISNTLTVDFCLIALKKALNTGNKPDIFNTDQGSQFTATEFIKVLLDAQVQVSMDGKGKEEHWIIFLLKGFGERLNMRIFT